MLGLMSKEEYEVAYGRPMTPLEEFVYISVPRELLVGAGFLVGLVAIGAMTIWIWG